MPRPNIATLLTSIALLCVVVASVWLRWPGFVQGGFASHDVAGILYNAMVIEHGGLPYVDTLELKPPGSFYLATLLAGPEGRDIARFQIAANAWALLGLVAVAGIGWRVWGRLGSLVAAGLYALHDACLDSMDANYVTWANLPQILGFWLGLEATRGPARRRPLLWLGAGVLAAFATLCKQPNGVVLLPLLVMAVAQPWIDGGADRRSWWRGPVWLLGGFLLAHVPLVLRYLVAGRFGALVDGYFYNRWGLRYVAAKQLGLLEAVGEGALASAHFLGLALVFAAFVIALAAGRGLWLLRRASPIEPGERDELLAIAWLGTWLLATLFAASLGFRFYKGYFLAVAAPACLLAAAPSGLLGRRCRAWWPARVLVLSLASVLLWREALILDQTRDDRFLPHDLGGRRIADHLLANTEPDDTIWVWGWHLWDVYPLTGRMSASRVYKSLGILSQPNDDTWRRPATPLRFVASEHSRELLRELERELPAYIVLGSTVPHAEFRELQTFLRAHYRRDHRVRIGRVQFWALR